MIVESLSSRNATRPLFDGVEITSDTLTGRGGLVLFSRYLRNLEIFGDIDRLFGSMRKSSKGLSVTVLFHQIFCFFIDGTSRHLVRFDELKRDDGYAAAIETFAVPDGVVACHQALLLGLPVAPDLALPTPASAPVLVAPQARSSARRDPRHRRHGHGQRRGQRTPRC
jgi:hypothetical protein